MIWVVCPYFSIVHAVAFRPQILMAKALHPYFSVFKPKLASHPWNIYVCCTRVTSVDVNRSTVSWGMGFMSDMADAKFTISLADKRFNWIFLNAISNDPAVGNLPPKSQLNVFQHTSNFNSNHRICNSGTHTQSFS